MCIALGCCKESKSTNIKARKGPWLIIEDVWIEKKDKYEEWEPHVQAVENNRGVLALRFCYWKRNTDGSKGVLVRSPMLVYDFTIEDLREEAKKHKAKVILNLFKKLVE